MTAPESLTAAPASPVERDLGFGSVVSRESRERLLNTDGSFNVRRDGLGRLESLSAYHFLLTITWPRFLLLVAAGYLATNVLFAAGYLACGLGALTGPEPGGAAGRAFFFSVETLATIGYGVIVPANLPANLLMTFESLIGLLGFALVAGITFARVARPVPRILFSQRALIAPYRGGSAFMFRIVNLRSSQLLELRARVIFVRRGSAGDRNFEELRLERSQVVFFPLSWTVVHPIDRESPLWGLDAAALRDLDVEFLVLLTGIEETFAQNVYARRSYAASEVVWGARFKDMFARPAAGVIAVDVRRLHEYDAAAPTASG